MAIGALCGLTRPVGAAVVFAVVIALLFTLVRQKTHMASDTAISVFSSDGFLQIDLQQEQPVVIVPLYTFHHNVSPLF